MPNKLIEKIRAYFKKIDIEDQSANDDFIQYEPLPQIYINSLNNNIDDSNKEKILQELADRNGF